MSRWRWALLIFELFLFALILHLPQVDLPATAFQGGTAPMAVKARLTSVPALVAVLLPLGLIFSPPTWELFFERRANPAGVSSQSRLALLCTLIC